MFLQLHLAQFQDDHDLNIVAICLLAISTVNRQTHLIRTTLLKLGRANYG